MDLQRVIAALRRSAALLAVAAVSAFLVAAAVVLVRPDVYEASALVDVARLVQDDGAFSSAERADRTVANELVLAEDQQVAARAAERLGGVDAQDLQDDVSVEQLTGTDNIRFTASAGDPRDAARTATEYAQAYEAARREERRAVVRGQAEDVSRQLDDLQRQLDTLAVVPVADDSREQALREQYSQLVGRQVQLRAAAGDDDGTGLTLLPAPVPVEPAGAGPLPWGVLAAFLAVALGSTLVAARARSRDAVEFRSDLEDLGLPVLAEAPRTARRWRSRRTGQADAAVADEAARGLVLGDGVPAEVEVVSVDGLDHGDLVARLVERLGERGPSVVDATAAVGAERWRAEPADLVLLVVVRGCTRRADVSRTVQRLARRSPGTDLPGTGYRGRQREEPAGPGTACAAVLLEPGRRRGSGDGPGETSGSTAEDARGEASLSTR